jgi:ketosteroid isomerase-like protein
MVNGIRKRWKVGVRSPTLSQDNSGVVERFYAALDARDLDGLAATLAEQTLWSTPRAIPFDGRLVGRERGPGVHHGCVGLLLDLRAGEAVRRRRL